jgi:isopropylmalate/homocitrate/citramalate synthase
VFEVAVSDTIGIAHPGQVPRVLEAVLAKLPAERVALHFHDTRGTALANVLASLPFGIATFDASAGGLGGCPYAPGAAGNLATDDLIYMLNGLGRRNRSVARRAQRGVSVHRDENRSPLAVAVRAGQGGSAKSAVDSRRSTVVDSGLSTTVNC